MTNVVFGCLRIRLSRSVLFFLAHLGWHANDLGRLSKMFDEMPNLYAEIVEHRADFAIEVRHLVEHFRQPAQVVGVPAKMGHDERRLRMLADQAVAFRVDLLGPSWLARQRPGPVV